MYCGKDRKIFLGVDGAQMIEPFDESQLQPASYDVLLGSIFLVVDRARLRPVDLGDTSTFQNLYERVELHPGGCFQLSSKGFVLACTKEIVTIPSDVVGRIEGRSSLARLGLVIEAAGYLDPGYQGSVTMELYNQLPVPIILRPGLSIAQLSFETATSKPDKIYGDECLGSHYQNSLEVVGSRYGT
jgi:dCTP deaminase